MKLKNLYIILLVFICLVSFSCAKQPGVVQVERPKKVKEDLVAKQYADLIKSELERYDDEPEASLEIIDEMIEESPDVAFFYYQRAVVNADAGRWEEVARDCREALRLNPTIIKAKIMLGRALGTLNQHEEAIRYLEEVRRTDPDLQEVYPLLAKEYMNSNKYKQAEKVMLQLMARDTEALVSYYYLGAIYGAYMRKPKKAIDIYERLLEREPENIQVIEAVSQLYLETDEVEKALAMLIELERHRPNDVSLKLKVAQIYYKIKQYPEAIERFEQILERNPDSDKIMYYLGVLYEETGQIGTASIMYRRVPPVSGLYKDARLRLAYLYKQSGDLRKAKSVLLEGINRKPKTVEFYQYLGGIYEREGNNNSAISTLNRATKYFRDDENLFFALGTLYERSGNHKKAIASMRRVLKINPKNASALNYIGYTLLVLGEDLDEAEDLLQEAATISPEDGYVLDSLGWLYFKRGNYTKAFFLLEKALKLEPKEPTILKHLGQVYMQRGENKKALEYFKKALQNLQKKDRVDQDEVGEIVDLIQEANKGD